MRAVRGLSVMLITTLAALAGGEALATTKCQKGTSTLYTESATCPAGFANVSSTMGGNFSTIGKDDAVRQQEQSIFDSGAETRAADQARAAQSDQAAAQQQPASKALMCGAIADQMRALETDMQQRHTRQSIEQASDQYQRLREQQLQGQC
ncbi:hypothetical protein [Cupriavidus sp. D384]|uniref:hypothetical protein n=1 Tax=Cupriavidus sp. D384 TaxID=1538095 RepID=UPI000A3F061F|nr:hypothetical protein [Cupriavidus sp. D384]